ncbi:transmembrane protein 230-like isoform X1 [Sebastes umbrosus]|uniref:transmembrane protein 230-like isoform X1 n=2 Tax=Sebastes umbrosus TaxID=72105 RepID=UPI00189C93C4|nr:transmembrane protein 230-like isoform X1 [Sebastes umbrosus]
MPSDISSFPHHMTAPPIYTPVPTSLICQAFPTHPLTCISFPHQRLSVQFHSFPDSSSKFLFFACFVFLFSSFCILNLEPGNCTRLPLLMKATRSNMLGTGISNNKVKYSRLAADDDGYIDLQFKKSPPKVPYKAIALAIFLFLIGSLLIIFGALLLSGTIKVEHPDRTIPVIIIGLLVFLPGFYHLRIAYYAAKGYRGYSYDDIPDFGD